jgi:hypothetical protein
MITRIAALLPAVDFFLPHRMIYRPYTKSTALTALLSGYTMKYHDI